MRMNLNKSNLLKASLIVAFIVLATMVGLLIKSPSPGSTAEEIQKTEILRGDKELIVQFVIVNPDHIESFYDIKVVGTASNYQENIRIPAEKSYCFIYHIRPDEAGGGETDIYVYKNGGADPIEHLTCNFEAEQT